MAEKKLGQNAIDAIFRERSASGTATAAEAAVEGHEVYQYGRASQISGEQMRAIRTVNDQFARNLTHTLGAWLRTGVQISVSAAEQMPFGDFLSEVSEPSFLTLLRLEPLGGMGVMELDVVLALRVVDLLLGGQGAAQDARSLTEIEAAILAEMIGMIVRELNATWGSVGLYFVADRKDPASDAPRVMTTSERTLSLSLEMQLLGACGMLKVCVPAVVLNTVHRRLLGVRERPRRRVEGGRSRVAELVSGTQAEVSLQMPPFKVGLRQLEALQPGDTLETGMATTVPAALMWSGVRLAAAAPVQHGEHRGGRLLAEKYMLQGMGREEQVA